PIYIDRNGDYILDNRDYSRSGNTQPLVTGGLQNTFQYKNLQFSIYASYTAKRTILNYALAQRLDLLKDPFGGKTVVPIGGLDVWLKEGDVAKYPYPYDYSRNNS